jgi:hypothetical protein
MEPHGYRSGVDASGLVSASISSLTKEHAEICRWLRAEIDSVLTNSTSKGRDEETEEGQIQNSSLPSGHRVLCVLPGSIVRVVVPELTYSHGTLHRPIAPAS